MRESVDNEDWTEGLVDLINMASSVEKADGYIEEFSERTKPSEKLQYLENLFKHSNIEVIARCDPKGVDSEQRASDDYYAVLSMIVNEKWR